MTNKIKLSWDTKFTVEGDTEEIQSAMLAMPQLQAMLGMSSAQNSAKQIVSYQHYSLEDGEKVLIQHALAQAGTKTEKAAALGITRSTLDAKIKKYGIET